MFQQFRSRSEFLSAGCCGDYGAERKLGLSLDHPINGEPVPHTG
jgi:hypothetical protein